MCMCIYTSHLFYFCFVLFVADTEFIFIHHFFFHFFNEKSLCTIQKIHDSVKKEKAFCSPNGFIPVKYDIFISVHNKRMCGFGTVQRKNKS